MSPTTGRSERATTSAAPSRSSSTGSGNDTITGSAIDNAIFTGAVTTRSSGGAGDDEIDAGAGADTLLGEARQRLPLGGRHASDAFRLTAATLSVVGRAPTRRRDPRPSARAHCFAGRCRVDHAGRRPRRRLLRRGRQLRQRHRGRRPLGGDGPNTIIGTAAINILSTGDGNDAVTGGAGKRHPARRARATTRSPPATGSLDRVDCGAGTDTAVVDTLDVVLSELRERPGRGRRQRQRGRTPDGRVRDAGRERAAAGRASTVTVTASDDQGHRARRAHRRRARSSPSTPRRHTRSPTSPRAQRRRQEHAHRPGGRHAATRRRRRSGSCASTASPRRG